MICLYTQRMVHFCSGCTEPRFAFLESSDFESAVKLAISYGSDSDTIGAMAGAIVEAYYGEIPKNIAVFCRKKVPDCLLVLLDAFYDTVKCKKIK